MPEVKWEEPLPNSRLNRIQINTNYVGVCTMEPVFVHSPYYSQRVPDKKKLNYETSGICHKPFNEIIQDAKNVWSAHKEENKDKPLHMWWCIPSTNSLQKVYSDKEINEWSEFCLDLETSPWRDVLKEFDYSVTRNEEGLVTGLVMPIPNINTIALFHLFKGLRGVVERRCMPFLHAKREGITDKTLLYKLFVLSSFFVQKGDSPRDILFHVGGEHTAFKMKLNNNVLNGTVTCKLKNHSLLNTGYYYGQQNMGGHVFGQQTLPDSIHSRGKTFVLENLQKGTGSVLRGFFLKVTEPQWTFNGPTVDMDKLIEKVDEVWEFLS